MFDVYGFPDAFSKEDVEEINKICTNYYESSITDKPANVTKNAEVSLVPWFIAKTTVLHKLYNVAYAVNKTQLCFDIYEPSETDFINYNVYRSKDNGQYDWHTDGSDRSDAWDTKYTVIANISTEDYGGGEFEVFQHGIKHIDVLDTPGSVIVFPSIINHRVKPVTEGERRTLSLWITGPRFR